MVGTTCVEGLKPRYALYLPLQEEAARFFYGRVVGVKKKTTSCLTVGAAAMVVLYGKK